MGPCDDLPAKPELLHWGTMRRARREPVTQVCRASVNSAIKEHGITCRATAATLGGNASCVRALSTRLPTTQFRFKGEWISYRPYQTYKYQVNVSGTNEYQYQHISDTAKPCINPTLNRRH
ncbi:hypothetical protein AVEN_128133-1 [Araneus ventricosus]|uniref:Uncharacterized protein n=1 Tax=Araneus ventricosus TaxID=182803 RepID=A0A4Y1ZZK9_ARAVE|nr:hypothetical protein AVEN_128133-1 [Araneus ventricosus]